MSLTVTLDLPPDVEEKLRAESTNLNSDVREAYALELFRRGTLSHLELSQTLGLDRFATDAFLQRHHVLEGSLTMEDLNADLHTLNQLFSKE